MKKVLLAAIFSIIISASYAQLMISKLVGKHSNNSKIGYGTFAYFDVPLNDEQNTSFRLEILDLALFPPVDEDMYSIIGYISIKLGYKKIFSDTKTGIYIEPQAGYCRVVPYQYGLYDGVYGDGVAVAMETGYSLEVGQRGQTLNFGLKYESDIGSKNITANSIGLRISYCFNTFGRKSYY
jgi:hypothetical protein